MDNRITNFVAYQKMLNDKIEKEAEEKRKAEAQRKKDAADFKAANPPTQVIGTN